MNYPWEKIGFLITSCVSPKILTKNVETFHGTFLQELYMNHIELLPDVYLTTNHGDTLNFYQHIFR